MRSVFALTPTRPFSLALIGAGAPLLTMLAQSPQSPSFEVASVKLNKEPVSASAPMSVRPEGDRLTLRNIPLKQLVQMAFEVDADDVIGPGWMASERFDVVAKAGAPFSSTNRWQPMLKALLVERFHLSSHMDARAADVFDLVRARKDGSLGPRLHPSNENCYADLRAGKIAADASSDRCGLPGNATADITGHIKVHGVPLSVLLGVLAVELRTERPTDATGLTGSFDFELVWTPQSYSISNARDRRPEADRSAPAMTTALQEQLGLRLERRKGSKDVVVVDHVERLTED